MTTPTAFAQIRRHIDSAQRLIDWSNADISFGGDSDTDAADHLKQAYEHLDAAKALIQEHRPFVRFHTRFEGELVGLDENAPMEWVRVAITAGTVPVLWRNVEEETV